MSHIIRPKRSALAVPFNNTVFSLGIVLIKLWFGKPFQDLPESMGLAEGLGLTVSIKIYRAACSLLPRIHEEAGYLYWIAVRHCIAGPDCPCVADTLEIYELKNRFYIWVIPCWGEIMLHT
ncbi:hypothetical protein BDD12DRAFT_844880 [Trichophaea hybrida]|nr:hypothetical protein BDD12DRAFT_844880 [Trichophaea hybrida]